MSKTVVLFGLLAIFAAISPARAQYVDIPGVPHTTIHDNSANVDVPVFIGAFNTPLGPSLGLFEPGAVGQFKTFWASSLSIDWPTPPVTPAQANAFITTLLPQINGAIANRFALTVAAPAACGNLACDAVNTALYTSWGFTNASDGSTVLGAH